MRFLTFGGCERNPTRRGDPGAGRAGSGVYASCHGGGMDGDTVWRVEGSLGREG